MWSELEKIFEQIGLPYSRQGSYADEEYPESFFTFWNLETDSQCFYDNKSNENVWTWYIYFYTRNADLLYSKLEEFITLAKEKKFIINGKGKDCLSDDENYLGRYVVIKYIATEK